MAERGALARRRRNVSVAEPDLPAQDGGRGGRLRDVFVTGETAYFDHANLASYSLDAYYDHADTGWTYLRDNMTPAGRAAYRSALVALQAEAQGLVGDVGTAARKQLVATCIGHAIAAIDTLASS